MPSLVKLVEWAQQVLPLGGWGLFVAAFLDSSFLPLPNVVDLWVISLCVVHPSRMLWYASMATLGSLAGCCLLYLVVRKGEEIFWKGNPRYSRLGHVQAWVEKYGALAMVTAALLPPPSPFKLFVIAAGLMKYRLDKFLLALLIGRSIRYGLEGILAVRYGRQTWEWIVKNGPLVSGSVVLAMVIALVVWRVRRKASGLEARPSTPPHLK